MYPCMLLTGVSWRVNRQLMMRSQLPHPALPRRPLEGAHQAVANEIVSAPRPAARAPSPPESVKVALDRQPARFTTPGSCSLPGEIIVREGDTYQTSYMRIT